MPINFTSPNVCTDIVREVLNEDKYRYVSFQPSKNTNKKQDFAVYIIKKWYWGGFNKSDFKKPSCGNKYLVLIFPFLHIFIHSTIYLGKYDVQFLSDILWLSARSTIFTNFNKSN
jgi:hypothetical protein